MCGFIALVDPLEISPKEINLISNTLEVFKERGPDMKGTAKNNFCAVGFNRLKINDLSTGKQPRLFKLFDEEDFSILCFNGEIFNYKELEKEYLSKPFNRDEVGVLVDLYKKFKEDFIGLINGQYALAICDSRNKEVILARDPFGIRPLYYTESDSPKKQLIFGSDLRAFKELGLIQKIDLFELGRIHLTWSTSSERTLWKGINQIKPGTLQKFKICKSAIIKLNVLKFWDWGTKIANRNTSNKKLTKDNRAEFRYQLKSAIYRQTMSEVGYSSYLSGGIDSSVIAYELSKIEKNLKTFSVSFKDLQYDESKKQQLISDHINSKHISLIIDDNLLATHFKTTTNFIQQPFFRTAPVPMMLLAKEVKKNNQKVVLSGEGADEILLGYDIFREMKCVQFIKDKPNSKWRKHIFDNLYSYLPQFKNKRYRNLAIDTLMREGDFGVLNPLKSRLSNNLRTFMSLKKGKEISEEVLRRLLQEYEDYSKNNNLDDIGIVQLFEINNLLSGYLLSSQGDRVSMASSIEGRYPFLDLEFVNYALNIPESHKLKGTFFKRILREAYSDLIPNSIINAPKIAYQAPEARAIFKSNEVLQILSNPNQYAFKFYDYDIVQKIIERIKKCYDTSRGSFGDNMTICIMSSASFLINN